MWKNKEFAEAYSDYYPLVFSAVNLKTGCIEDTEDICHEIFIKFYEKLESIENYRKWLYGAIRLEILNYYKKKKPDVNIDEMLNDIGMTFVNGFRDTRIIIKEAIENMDNFDGERDKTIFDLIAIHGFTYEETASQLGLSKRQIRYKYGLIVNRIQDYLSEKNIKSLEDIL